MITISDGIISANINVAIRNLIHYGLPYFYGEMTLSLINPTEVVTYVKIQFHENSERQIPPITLRLEGNKMKNLKLSEEMDVSLKGGWVEVFSAETIFGGVWTNNGYLHLEKIDV